MLDAETSKELIGMVKGSLLTLGAPIEVTRAFDKLVAEHYERKKQAEVDQIAARIFEGVPDGRKRVEKPIGGGPSEGRGARVWTPEQRALHGERVKKQHEARRAKKAKEDGGDDGL